MLIAIVDDDPTLRISLKHFLHRWCSEREITLEMQEFDNGNSFLSACADNKFDVVFMDIFMSEKDGIKTASEMRIRMKDTILIFLTSSADHMPDAFSVHAFGYLLKPLLPEKLFKLMNDVRRLVIKDDRSIEITVGKVNLTIRLSDILYINSDSNYCIVHCPDEHKCRGPFTNLSEELLSSKDFCIINRGICVNLSHVSEMNATDCVMDNGDYLPINTKKAPAIRQQYMSYKLSSD